MKKIFVLGGGTFSYVRNHLAVAAPAFGQTAKNLANMCKKRFTNMETHLVLTKMADPYGSNLVTNKDVAFITQMIKEDLDTKVVFFSAAMCDYDGFVADVPSGKHATRLHTREGCKVMKLTPADKVIQTIRQGRKDIFVIGFKTTTGASLEEQYKAGLGLLKGASLNLVLANDVISRMNMIITPEEARYHINSDRYKVLELLVDMTYYRSQLTFTRSTVVEGEPIPWNSSYVFPALREVVNYCIGKNAYKPFNGATVGHFACKTGPTEFLTSIRKTNFNDLEKNGLVRIVTSGPDKVIVYGAKPSVGGQSQRIVFDDHVDYDCIVHFHCPLKNPLLSAIPVVSQREYECGSHQCGQNTSKGLRKFGNLLCVMLDNHGPNIVFNHDIDPQEVIKFIEDNFDLSKKTGGPVN